MKAGTPVYEVSQEGNTDVTGPNNPNAAVFTNVYTATGKLELTATKTVNGETPKADEVFNFSLSNIALVLTLNGLISLFLQVALFDTMVSKWGERRVIRLCFFLAAICTIWITQAHTKLEVMVATLIIFSAFDLLRPAITTLLTKASESDQGLINGLNMSLTSIGNIVGPIMSGMLLDWNTHVPYLVVAVFLIVSYLMAFLLKQPGKQQSTVN